MGSVGEEESSLVVDVVTVELLELVEHSLDVDDDSVAEDVDTLVVEYSAWKQVEGVLLFIDDDGVTGISASVESSADVVFFSEEIDKFSFTFVTPLGAEDCADSGFES